MKNNVAHPVLLLVDVKDRALAREDWGRDGATNGGSRAARRRREGGVAR
jgi:hypothetical protein